MEKFPLEESNETETSYQIQFKEQIILPPLLNLGQMILTPLTNMCNPLSYTLPHHMLDNLCELSFSVNSQQVVTKGYPN